jgi:hypothetical protein
VPTYELWINSVHRPLDVRTPTQAIERGKQFARRYRTPNVHEVFIMQCEDGKEPQQLAIIHPWSEV